jgi:hypothetical protein
MKGRLIDYSAPRQGEPTTRTRDDREEHWCPPCGRWGNHLLDGHADFLQWRAQRRAKRADKRVTFAAAAIPAPATPSETPPTPGHTYHLQVVQRLRSPLPL